MFVERGDQLELIQADPRLADARIDPELVSARPMCPYCLYKGRITEFLVLNKDGYSHKKARCPDCKNGMLLSSLLEISSIQGLVEFLREIRKFDRYGDLIQWDKLKRRLKEYGISSKFWDIWYKLKDIDQRDKEV